MFQRNVLCVVGTMSVVIFGRSITQFKNPFQALALQRYLTVT